MKGPWYVPHIDYADSVEEVFTLSLNPESDGWDTDGGCPGYGLPGPVAVALAEHLNSTAEGRAIAELWRSLT